LLPQLFSSHGGGGVLVANGVFDRTNRSFLSPKQAVGCAHAPQLGQQGDFGTMKLRIDNLDGQGLRDYTAAIDGLQLPQIHRRLNQPAELRLSLVADSPEFIVPVPGARVLLGRLNGSDVFTGYVSGTPQFELLGWGERGPVYRYSLLVLSDEMLLDQKVLPARSPFAGRAAGEVLRMMAQYLLPEGFDLSNVADLDVIPWYRADPAKKWSEHVAALGLLARAAYRAQGGRVSFAALGQAVYGLDESSPTFSPEGLQLESTAVQANDVTVYGHVEPQAFVKDYFVGDGVTLRFNMSHTPFLRNSTLLLDEEYKDAALRPEWWSVVDPRGAISVNSGKLQVAGGTGTDGQTTLSFAERIELGGAAVLQHGDISLDAASDAVLGGLYGGNVNASACLAGFRVTPSGAQNTLQGLVGGVPTGSEITTQSGHRYVLTTRLYSTEAFRREQTFHSSQHPAGEAEGAGTVDADVRVVLEVRDVDPANPATLAAASTVLFDGVVTQAPAFCTYALVNSATLHCSIAFTRILQTTDAVVRSALPGESYRTRLVGAMSEGAECYLSSSSALQFFGPYVPAANEQITVTYRGSGKAAARMRDEASISANGKAGDDGVRGAVKTVLSPAPRTSEDCENAARALLDDAARTGWKGQYETWSDFLPGGAEDIFPGDALAVNVPSRNAAFSAVVREVTVQVVDLAEDHSRYKIQFSDDAAAATAMQFEPGRGSARSDLVLLSKDVPVTLPGDIRGAEITTAGINTMTIDAGVTPAAGGGIEVRRSDAGWGADNDRNLLGRFTTRTLTVPRLARVQDYYLRLYDAGSPRRYSRHSMVLHADVS